jgi:outer membrane protein TolC
MKLNKIFVALLGVLLIQVFGATAQQPTTLKALLQMAETNYPLLKAKQYAVGAAQKSVEVSTHTKIPSLDAAYQIDYATYNNITGMAYPQLLIPISGPPATTNNFSGVFGSAASLLLNWQPITFGQREAQIAYAQSGVTYASADLANDILQHKIKVANAYLDLLTFTELDKLYKENMTRAEANFTNVKTLVANGIKAGVDSALFSAEVAKANIDRFTIQKNIAQTIISLQQLSGTDVDMVIADSSLFTKLPVDITMNDTVKNPLVSLYNTSIELDKAKRKTIAKTTSPTLGVWATTYARGSGVAYTGDVKALNGLGLQRYNYGVGMQLSVPLLQSLKIKPQLQQQDLLIKADEEKLHDVALQLNKQWQAANANMDYALKTIKAMPVLVQSSYFAYTTIISRYNSGLANYADVVQAQYNLLKAQTDYKTAYMAVWKTLLYKAAVKGDISLFLNQVN